MGAEGCLPPDPREYLRTRKARKSGCKRQADFGQKIGGRGIHGGVEVDLIHWRVGGDLARSGQPDAEQLGVARGQAAIGAPEGQGRHPCCRQKDGRQGGGYRGVGLRGCGFQRDTSVVLW